MELYHSLKHYLNNIILNEANALLHYNILVFCSVDRSVQTTNSQDSYID